MIHYVVGPEGLELLRAVPDRYQGPTPLRGTASTLNVKHFWAILPDDLRELPSPDKRYIEEAWKALTQGFAETLADAAHLDQLNGLLDMPLAKWSKWVPLHLETTLDMAAAPAQARRRAAGADQSQLRQGTAWDAIWVPLRGSVTQEATLRADIELSRTTVDGLAWTLFGYGDHTRTRVSAGVYAGLSSEGEVALLVKDSSGDSRWVHAATSIDPSVERVQVSLWYERAWHRPGWLTVRVRELEGEFRTVFVATEVEETWAAQTLGVSSVDIASTPQGVPVVPGIIPRTTVVLQEMAWLDPSVDPTVVRVPWLQPEAGSDNGLLREQIEYDLVPVGTRAFLSFKTQPPEMLWAEYVGLDIRLMEKLFGVFIPEEMLASGPDSFAFRNQLVGLLYALLQGPRLSALSVAVSAATGVPIALQPGEVVRISHDGTQPYIVVRTEDRDMDYPYAPALQPAVAVGQLVERMQPLTETATVLDWKTSPSAMGGGLLHEAQKYSSIRVEIPAGTSQQFEDRPDLPDAIRSFLRQALPLWASATSVFLTLVKRLSDPVVLGDAKTLEGELVFRSALTNGSHPRYNEGVGHVYDGDPGIVYDEWMENVLSDQLVFIVQNMDPL